MSRRTDDEAVTGRKARRLPLVVVIGLTAMAPLAARQQASEVPPWRAFIAAASTDRRQSQAALEAIAAHWRDGYAAMIVDVARFLPSRHNPRAAEDPFPADLEAGFENNTPGGLPGRGDFPTVPRQPHGSDVRQRLTRFLERHTGQRFGDDLRAWRRWMWSLPHNPHPDYAEFKADIYARIDPRFRAFFPPGVSAGIRLDEIDWGGVPVNGIPPLRYPKTIPASEATWLRDSHLVFGLVVDSEARAYPKRILAWHEMALDRVGGVELTIVYCTLCGTVIPYDSIVEGRRFTFGTSGLLYRSNKLMFDEETESLWSSLEGVPVVGPLTVSGLRLTFHPAVTTTWGEWKREHPSTTVLSLDTGFDRNYAEGAAYRDYFATDRLMFEVPTTDKRLRNKAEVLVLRPEVLGSGARPVAIAIDRLQRESVFSLEAGNRRFVVITSKAGANMVYERGARTFALQVAGRTVADTDGVRWTLTSDALVSESGERLPRVPVHRAFWFGWVAQHPDTVLFK